VDPILNVKQLVIHQAVAAYQRILAHLLAVDQNVQLMPSVQVIWLVLEKNAVTLVQDRVDCLQDVMLSIILQFARVLMDILVIRLLTVIQNQNNLNPLKMILVIHRRVVRTLNVTMEFVHV
jgi:hypothetical protein